MEIKEIISKNELEDAFRFLSKNLNLDSNHPRDLAFYLNQLSRYPQFLLRAEEHGRTEGVFFASADGKSVLMGELAVSVNQRGKNLGSKLLGELEARAKRLGFKTMYGGALETAETFYIKNNYLPKLFIQLSSKESAKKLGKFLSELPKKYKVTWSDMSDKNQAAKAVIQTDGLDKTLQAKVIREFPDAHTQQLFYKDLT